MVLDLKRATIFIGGMDEEVERKILDQEGNL
jgi:hypothetical protein